MLEFFSGWSARHYIPQIDFRPDVVSRGGGVEEWLAHGKVPLVGEGIRGGGYQFAHGQWDGKDHTDDIQQAKRPDIAWESSGLTWARVPCGQRVEITGPAPTMFGAYYMVPTEDFVRFHVEMMLNRIREGVYGIEYDEPEFFHRAGYSEGFKREWRKFYGDEWVDPESSHDARFRAEKLKSFLLFRMVQEVFRAVKKRYPGMYCMVNPHSPLNYAELFGIRSVEGGITSIQGALVHMPEVDGVLGEVWSDTIRAPIIYLGRPTVEPFLHSYAERSYFRMLCMDSPRRLVHLLDPKSDDPKYPWAVYRQWFEEDTLAAWLLGGQHFMVAWPDRLYIGDQPPAGPAPDEYKTVFTTFMNVCRELEKYPYDTLCGIGVPITDTVMWQRGSPGRNYLDALYALTLPLIDQGVEVQILPLERGPETAFMDKFKVLLTSFDFWQPHEQTYADGLIEWVKRGGVMVYFGTSEFDDVPSAWWRKAGYDSNFAYLMKQVGCDGFMPTPHPLEAIEVSAPLQGDLPAVLFGEDKAPETWNSLRFPHFYEPPQLLLGMPEGSEPLMTTKHGEVVAWQRRYGKGWVIYVGISPWHLAYGIEGAQILRAFTRHAAAVAGIPYSPTGVLDVSRGPFRFVYTFREYSVPGHYLDLDDHTLKSVSDLRLKARGYAMLYRLPEGLQEPTLLFSSARCASQVREGKRLSLVTEGPMGTILVTALFWPGEPPSLIEAVDEVTGGNRLVWHSYEPQRQILRIAHRGGEKSVMLRLE